MENYIQLHFENVQAIQQEILIAQLSDIGFEGFEEGPDFLNAYISQDGFDQAALNAILDMNPHRVSKEIIAPKNWNEEWEKSFNPVIIENFCAISAVFHPPVTGVQHEIIITPKMSFGTGHHATTFQVIQLMREINFEGKKVLDFGTGTGVLAILAEKLNALDVLAIDNDDWSIENATENIAANKCLKITLQKKESLISNILFDVILANLNKHIILQNLPTIAKHLSINGVLVLSGLLIDDQPEIASAALKEHLFIKRHTQQSGWIALQLTNEISE